MSSLYWLLVGLLVPLALGKPLATQKGGQVARMAQPASQLEAVAQLMTRCPQHVAKSKWVTTVVTASEKASSDPFVTDG